MSYPIVYNPGETTFSHNGLGMLPDCIYAMVTETRNGPYELVLRLPVDGWNAFSIKDRTIIKAPAHRDNWQLFRVYSRTKTLDGIMTVKARHISYDLSGIPCGRILADSLTDALTKLKAKAALPCPFSFSTDITGAAKFDSKVPRSIRSCFGGHEGSLLDVYGGELEFDNFNVKVHKARGKNNGVSIRYGKNLTDIKQLTSCAEAYSGIYPYALDADGTVTTMTFDGDNIVHFEGDFPIQNAVAVDFSERFEGGLSPTSEELRAAAVEYYNENRVGDPRVSLTASYAQLGNALGYENTEFFERVNLCDTVNLYAPHLGISATAKVYKLSYNVLLDRVESVQLGDAQKKITDSIGEPQKAPPAPGPSQPGKPGPAGPPGIEGFYTYADTSRKDTLDVWTKPGNTTNWNDGSFTTAFGPEWKKAGSKVLLAFPCTDGDVYISIAETTGTGRESKAITYWINKRGESPVFSVGTVEALAPGSAPTVTMTGTDLEPILNFGIPGSSDTGVGTIETYRVSYTGYLTESGDHKASTTFEQIRKEGYDKNRLVYLFDTTNPERKFATLAKVTRQPNSMAIAAFVFATPEGRTYSKPAPVNGAEQEWVITEPKPDTGGEGGAYYAVYQQQTFAQVLSAYEQKKSISCYDPNTKDTIPLTGIPQTDGAINGFWFEKVDVLSGSVRLTTYILPKDKGADGWMREVKDLQVSANAGSTDLTTIANAYIWTKYRKSGGSAQNGPTGERRLFQSNTGSLSTTLYYSTSISTANGKIELQYPSSLSTSYDKVKSNPQTLKTLQNKYVQQYGSETVYYVAQRSSFKAATFKDGYITKYGVYATQAAFVEYKGGTESPDGYVASTEKNAYPQDGMKDGIHYVYKKQFGD